MCRCYLKCVVTFQFFLNCVHFFFFEYSDSSLEVKEVMKRYNFFLKLISKFIYDTFMINFHTYFYRNQYLFVLSYSYIRNVFF